MRTALLIDLYELTMAQSYYVHKSKSWATFDLFVRALPAHRSFLLACGLADLLDYIRNLSFKKDDIAYLRSQKLFREDFLRYLADFRFSGNIWALPEGTVFFANEPVVRVTAPIIEAQILESFFLNTINLQTMIASKAARVVLAARGRSVYDFSLRRTHGQDAGVKVARAAYLAGFDGTSNVLAGKIYKIPVAGTMAHSFVMSFSREIDSFLAYSDLFPNKTILLVDTYDTLKGIRNAITVGLQLKKSGFILRGIRLDSGDIASLSRRARAMLDQAGLKEVKIFASGNLDEFKIDRLLRHHASIDSFGVGTHMGTSSDAPSLDVIYKIAEVADSKGDFLPTMKLSRGKVTFPGRKQIFRFYNNQGICLRDVLGLENEKIAKEALLIKVVDKGKVIYTSPSLSRMRDYARDNLDRFPLGLQDVTRASEYPVVLSKGLAQLKTCLSVHLRKRQKG
jgi:nicotinate phosphoribosyltransferase